MKLSIYISFDIQKLFTLLHVDLELDRINS